MSFDEHCMHCGMTIHYEQFDRADGLCSVCELNACDKDDFETQSFYPCNDCNILTHHSQFSRSDGFCSECEAFNWFSGDT